MASLEGQVGEPRAKDVHTVERGLSGSADQPQQRGDVGQRPADHRRRERLVRRQGHGAEQGHEDLRPHRQGQQHRPGRGADGHDASRDHLRHRRRRAERQRASRPCRPAAPPAAASRLAVRPARGLRGSGRSGLHDGLGRHGRHGRVGLHGRRGPVLPGLPRGGVLRQVRALPTRHRPHAGDPHRHHRRVGGPWSNSTP